MKTNYDKAPYIDSRLPAEVCDAGWDMIGSRLLSKQAGQRSICCVECYPGVFESEIEIELVRRLKPDVVLRARDAYRSPDELRERFAGELTDDSVFGRISEAEMIDWFDPVLLKEHRSRVEDSQGHVLLIGAGAILLAGAVDFLSSLVYADMARWELQRRQRRNLIGNVGHENHDARANEKYKRAFFLDWRVADRLKRSVLPRADFLLDTNCMSSPKLISGEVFRAALARAVRGPLRVVPFFDPGPWGGEWMREHFDLPSDAPNYAWCFDCVPEENSLLLGFGDLRFEVPAQDLVLFEPEALMGEAVHARFGFDFPIRFDLLDTMGGGNLSFQVHPLTAYIRDHFNMAYTQDESYYMLDAAEAATVYLGLVDGVEPQQMEADLRRANTGDGHFAIDRYVNQVPAKKHDHFLIPAGTPHCSGRDCMVLEISATPYIFTFKLWDWGRLGLDGRPRPVHLEDGMRNIQWDRTTEFVRRELVNAVTPVGSGPGWIEERTGLHALEFIETRRHWFTAIVDHETGGGVNVLNLVEGSEAIVESPTDSFAAFVVHYAETFIVPALVGSYTIRPGRVGERCATLKASIRTEEQA